MRVLGTKERNHERCNTGTTGYYPLCLCCYMSTDEIRCTSVIRKGSPPGNRSSVPHSSWTSSCVYSIEECQYKTTLQNFP